MREIGKRMLFVLLLLGSTFQTLLGQTEFEQIFVIQKFENNGENLTFKILDRNNFFRFYNLPNDESLYLNFEAVGDTSMMYGFLDNFQFEEFPSQNQNVPFDKLTFSWVFHDDFDNEDLIWPGELIVYHKSTVDAYTLKLINTNGNLIKVEGYIEGTQNFEEGE